MRPFIPIIRIGDIVLRLYRREKKGAAALFLHIAAQKHPFMPSMDLFELFPLSYNTIGPLITYDARIADTISRCVMLSDRH